MRNTRSAINLGSVYRVVRNRLSLSQLPAAIHLTLFYLVLVGPAAAQTATASGGSSSGNAGATGAICGTVIAELVSGALLLMGVLGVLGAVVVYKWTAVSGIITQNQQKRQELEQRKANVKSNVMWVLILEPLYLVAAALTPLPGLGCAITTFLG